jgi:hypothetical protein
MSLETQKYLFRPNEELDKGFIIWHVWNTESGTLSYTVFRLIPYDLHGLSCWENIPREIFKNCAFMNFKTNEYLMIFGKVDEISDDYFIVHSSNF